MTELTGMTPQELSDWCKAQGMPAFRGKQIFRWIHQGADFDAMTNLPAAMRAQLKEIAVAQPVSIIDERKSQIDDTVKFLFGLKDGNCVEGVSACRGAKMSLRLRSEKSRGTSNRSPSEGS